MSSSSSFLSVSTTPRFSAPKQGLTTNTWSSTNQISLSKSSSNFIPRLSSSSSTSTPIAEDEQGQAGSESPSTAASSVRGCRACGKEEIEQGCDGDGRVQGGIATVPGFGWWPIKAYRPCPGFVASGGRYKRIGQTMDEVAGLGRAKKVVVVPIATTTDDDDDDMAPSSNKKQGSRKMKK